MLGQAVESEEQLLHLNRLDYVQSPPTSLVVARDIRTHPAREQSMTISFLPPTFVGEFKEKYFSEPVPNPTTSRERTVTVTIPSGSRFVNPTTSYVKFQFALDKPCLHVGADPDLEYWLSFNVTSSLDGRMPNSRLPFNSPNMYTNLFSTARWTHSGRRDIEDVLDVPHTAYLYAMKQSSDWFTSVGSTFTLAPTIVEDQVTTYYPVWNDPNVERRFATVCIPLAVLFPSWRKNKDQLLPAQLVGGSSFEFVFAPLEQSFVLAPYREEVLNPEDCEVINWAAWRYHIRDFAVVLDERELCASANSLMWDASLLSGTPIQPDSTMVMYSEIPFPNAVEHVYFKEPNDAPLFERCVKNLSRVTTALVTPVVRPAGVLLDAWTPLVRMPQLDFLDFIGIAEYRFSSGSGYWPLKEPTWTQNAMTAHSFLQWLWSGGKSLSLEEFGYWVGGFAMQFTRQSGNSESGVPIQGFRPMELNFALDWIAREDNNYSSLELIEKTYKKYYLRWAIDYQRFINVRGNVLECLE